MDIFVTKRDISNFQPLFKYKKNFDYCGFIFTYYFPATSLNSNRSLIGERIWRAAVRDILSEGGTLFYTNNNWFNFHQIKIRTSVLDSLDMILKNSEPENLLRREKQIKKC
jgi:hypothetical protein